MSNQVNEKPHWKKIFKSDHLGVYDLDELVARGVELIFTISHGIQYDEDNKVKVAGRMIAANIVWFNEDIKPWVVNSGNAKILQRLSGTGLVPDWAGTTIRLFADPNVKMKGETVGGIKIYPHAVKKTLLVTDDNIREMTVLIEKTGSDVNKLLAFSKVNSLEQLTMSKYHTAMKMLAKKVKS
jgi:hypothetical protein